MKKELYKTPEMDVTYFEAEDIVTVSGDETLDAQMIQLPYVEE